jgi:hypothetical protein
VRSERRPVVCKAPSKQVILNGFSIGRTSVKKLLPPQAMRRILLGMRGLVRSYVTFAITGK